MSAGDTQPTEPLPDWAYSAPPAKRRRVWPWIVAAVVLVAIAIGVWIAGEALARSIVERVIREQVASAIALPPDQTIDVDVPGPVLPQVIGGTIDQVGLRADDVTIGDLTGDVRVSLQGVPVSGGDIAGGTATVVVDEAQLTALLDAVQDFPVESLGLDAPDVTVSTELSLFGLAVPLGVSLTPSAADDGSLVLTPSSLQLAGADISAEDLRRQFGLLTNAVVRDYTVCIQQYIPAGLALSDARVEGQTLVAEFAIDGAIVSDPALQENGTC
jgi:hypothetical protein